MTIPIQIQIAPDTVEPLRISYFPILSEDDLAIIVKCKGVEIPDTECVRVEIYPKRNILALKDLNIQLQQIKASDCIFIIVFEDGRSFETSLIEDPLDASGYNSNRRGLYFQKIRRLGQTSSMFQDIIHKLATGDPSVEQDIINLTSVEIQELLKQLRNDREFYRKVMVIARKRMYFR